MPISDPKIEISEAAKPEGSPNTPEPEFHPTFVDSTLPPISLFRQIWERLHEPKNTVPKRYYPDANQAGSPAVPGPEFHPTFVDTTLAPVSLYRQILERIHEPKRTIPKDYLPKRGTGNSTPAGGPASGTDFHDIFVDSTLPPVSLVRQIVEGFREGKAAGRKAYGRGTVTPPAPEATREFFEDPNQLLLFERPKAPSAPNIPGPIEIPDMLVELDPEAIKWRRRTIYLLSLILHGILVMVLVFSPDLMRRGRRMMGFPVEVAPRKDYSFLLLPPDVLRRLQQPPPENAPLSDKNRRAQGRSPVINPNGLRMPYSLGNSKLPEIAGGKPPAAAPTPPPGSPSPAPAGPPANQPSNQPGTPPKNDGLRFDEVKPETGGGGGGLNLPHFTPGQAIQQSLQSAARGAHSSGAGGGSSDGYGYGNSQFQNLEPNFSTEGPIILSDTQGVDFGPYLARVVYIVRRNWYSMIPESARLGERGRVSIVFEILKDGSVPQIRLVATSGSDPLDRAALASIHASIPFPPLPQEFTGQHLVLQFIYLYNMTAGQ